jgi:hypothetical protein
MFIPSRASGLQVYEEDTDNDAEEDMELLEIEDEMDAEEEADEETDMEEDAEDEAESEADEEESDSEEGEMEVTPGKFQAGTNPRDLLNGPLINGVPALYNAWNLGKTIASNLDNSVWPPGKALAGQLSYISQLTDYAQSTMAPVHQQFQDAIKEALSQITAGGGAPFDTLKLGGSTNTMKIQFDSVTSKETARRAASLRVQGRTADLAAWLKQITTFSAWATKVITRINTAVSKFKAAWDPVVNPIKTSLTSTLTKPAPAPTPKLTIPTATLTALAAAAKEMNVAFIDLWNTVPDLKYFI